MNKIEEYLTYLEEFYDKGSDLVEWNDLSNFERSYKLNRKRNEIKDRLAHLHKWRLSIGKKVYPSKKSWNYNLVENYPLLDSHNMSAFDNSCSVVFTEELFDRLCLDYINYSIDYLLRDLLERALTSNSTSKLQNLAFEWNLEVKQKLISDYKTAIESNT